MYLAISAISTAAAMGVFGLIGAMLHSRSGAIIALWRDEPRVSSRAATPQLRAA